MRKTRGTRTFEENEVLCGRFRVLRFIARGGMGEVYEAQDLSLDQRVALKTVPPRLAEDEVALRRFKREITLSRKISHPNICRVHDLFSEQDPESGEERFFLTMELLEGKSLGRLIKEKGRLESDEAMPIVEQIVAGLEEAHRMGIIHRDLKAENIFLAAEDDGNFRVAIMDFGLAKRFSSIEKETVTLSNGWVGTPAYVAPEQLRGGLATEASDIYSLGIIMYEMVTGRRPFEGHDPMSTAIRRLTEEPSAPSSFVRDLDPRWEYVILRCLRKKPADRFQQAGDILRALDPGTRLPRPGLHRTAILLIVTLILLAAAVLFFLHLPSCPAQAQKRPSMAMLGFSSLDPAFADDWLGPAMNEMLGTELESRGSLRLIPGEDVTRARIELGLEKGREISIEELQKLRRLLGADYVLSASFLRLGESRPPRIRVDLRIRETEDGKTAAVLSTEGEASDLFALVRNTGAKIFTKLGLDPGKALPSGTLGLPEDEKAVGEYSLALERLWSFDPLQAKELLEKAIIRQPDFALAHAALARAWQELGYGNRAAEEAGIAARSSGQLRREESLAIEALHRECSGEWEEAIRLYRALRTFYPDNPRYAFDLAEAQLRSGSAGAALDTVKEIRSGDLSYPEDRLDLLEAEILQKTADINGQKKLAARAARLARARGDRLIYGRARLKEAMALWSLGESRAARKALDAADEVFVEFRDQRGHLEALIAKGIFARDEGNLEDAEKEYRNAVVLAKNLGNVQIQAHATKLLGNLLLKKGRLDEAESMLASAMKLASESGDRQQKNVIAGRLALVQRQRGHLEEARKTYQESYSELLKLGDHEGAATTAGSLAIVLRLQGHPAEAAALFKESLRLKRQGGARRSISANLINLANISFDLGRLDEAEKYFRQALDLSREFKRVHHEAYALFGLGEISRERNRLDEARNYHEQALRLREKAGKTIESGASLMALALVDLDLGKIVSAREEATRALELFKEQSDLALRRWAEIVSARVEMRAGNLGKAKRLLSSAADSPGDDSDQTLKIFLLRSRAMLEELRGERSLARETLARCLALAESSQQMSARIEVLSALGGLEKKCGEENAARRHLEKARKLATENGYARLLEKIPSPPGTPTSEADA